MECNWDVSLSISDREEDQPATAATRFASQMGSLNRERALGCGSKSWPL